MLIVLVVTALALAQVGHRSTPTSSPVARGPWLGLNVNDEPGLGKLREFVDHGVVYDHDIDIVAGETPSSSGCRDWIPGYAPNLFFHAAGHRGQLDRTFGAGMVPVVTIDYCGFGDDFNACQTHKETNGVQVPFVTQCLPLSTSPAPYDIHTYVEGFVQTAKAILGYAAKHYPGHRVLFEPLNEPWGSGPPRSSEQATAAAYAAIVAQVLPAAREAGIPLSDIYVGAVNDGQGWVGNMYSAQPSLRNLVGGWYFHPYGLPNDDLNGIEGVAAVRDQYDGNSGWDNVIVSELGFCVTPYPPALGDHLPGSDVCAENTPEVDARTGFQAALWLTQTLDQAESMHAAGWLQAVIVWARDDSQPTRPAPAHLGYIGSDTDGWAMQLPGGSLTAQGAALEAFADASGGLPTADPAATQNPRTGDRLLAWVAPDGSIETSSYVSATSRWTTATRLGGELAAPDTSPKVLPFRTGKDGTHPPIFYVGADRRIWSWSWAGGRWHDKDIGGNVAFGSSPTAFEGARSEAIWVTYVGAHDHTLRQLVWNPSKARWSGRQLGGEPEASNSSPVAAAAPGTRPTIFYVGADHRLWLFSASKRGSRNHDLGTPVAPSTSPSASADPSNGDVWVAFVGAGDAISQGFWNPRSRKWSDARLVGEPAAPASSPSQLPYQRAHWASHQPIFYVGADSELWFWSWTGSSWRNSRLGGSAAPGSGPAALSVPRSTDLWVGYSGIDDSVDQWSLDPVSKSSTNTAIAPAPR